MARTSAGRRMRLTVPPHHAVNRHLGNLDEESDLNAEVLRLAEIGATLEELCGPMRSVAYIVKLLNFRGGPSLFAPAAVAPIHSSLPAPAAQTDALILGAAPPSASIQATVPSSSVAQTAGVKLGEPEDSHVVDASLAEHMWIPE